MLVARSLGDTQTPRRPCLFSSAGRATWEYKFEMYSVLKVPHPHGTDWDTEAPCGIGTFHKAVCEHIRAAFKSVGALRLFWASLPGYTISTCRTCKLSSPELST